MDLAALDATVTPLVVAAGEIALGRFRSGLEVEDKGGAGGYDPVTAADRATEAYLRAELLARFPGTEVVGEEGGRSGTEGGARWVVDPIDGTRSFVTGLPLWGVLVGLVVDEAPVAGWCRMPYLGETFGAVAGEGWADLRGRRYPLGSAPTTELAEATLYATHPGMFHPGPQHDAFSRIASRVRLTRFGADCYAYCLLALGHVDLVVDAGMQPYDIVPLVPVVEAAGGVVTDWTGAPPLAGGFVVAAANPTLHAAALATIALATVAADRENAP
ncbi:MAG: inositol monophosphatase family protein [Acidimicrobiales bacterium]